MAAVRRWRDRGPWRRRAHRIGRPAAPAMVVALFVGALAFAAPTPAQAYPCGSATCPWTGWMPLNFSYNGSPLAIAALVPGGVGGRIDAIVYSNPGCPRPFPCTGVPEFVGISSQVEPNGQEWTPVSPLPTGSGAGTGEIDLFVSAFRDGAGALHIFKGYRYEHLPNYAPTSVVGIDDSASGWGAWHPVPASSRWREGGTKTVGSRSSPSAGIEPGMTRSSTGR